MSAEFPRRDDHRPAFLRPKTPQKARSPSTPLPQEAPRKTPDAPAGRKPHADREGVGFCRLRQPGAFRPAPPQKKLRIARKGGFCRAPHRQGRAFPKKQRMRRNTHPCAARHAEKGEGRVLQRRARASRRGQTEETVFFTGNAGRSAPHGRPGKRLPAFPAIFPQPCLSKNKRNAARSTCSVDAHGTATGRDGRSGRSTAATPCPYWSGPPARVRKAAISLPASHVPQTARSAPAVRRFPSTEGDSRPPVPDARLPDDPVSFPA